MGSFGNNIDDFYKLWPKLNSPVRTQIGRKHHLLLSNRNSCCQILLIIIVEMEVQNIAIQFEHKLSEKAQENPTYRKAAGVLASLMHASKAIHNFGSLYANNSQTLALYIVAGVFKLLKRNLEGDQKHEHNIDAYLLLLSMAIPEASPDTLRQGGLLQQFRSNMQAVLARRDNTPLMTRLAIAVLSHSLADTTAINFRVGSDKALLLDLFQRSVASPRNNALSKESSRLLVHLLKNNPSVSAVIAEESKANLLANLQDRKQLYLANVKEVIIELPVRLINDICHRVAANLGEIDSSDQNQELYLCQTYFFLEKMTGKLLPSTLEDMILVLINSVPAGTQPERVQLSYLQLLYESILALANSNQTASNRLLSPVISVILELLLGGQKVGKFAGNLLTFVMNNCVRPSLWRKKEEQISLEGIDLQQSGRDFTKIICLLQGMLSPRFSNQRFAAGVISQFISKLEADAFSETFGLINHIVQYRSELEDKCFRKMMEAIFVCFGVENILEMYPLKLEGDIGSQKFEDHNNLWLLPSLQKSQREQSLKVYQKYLFPLLQIALQNQQNEAFSKQRRQAYHLIEDILWRCLKMFCKVVDSSINYEQMLLLIESHLKRVSDNTLLQFASALQFLSDALAAVNYKSLAAEQVIKGLAYIVNLGSASAKQILSAIKGLARLAPVAYIKKVFDKNIQKLISQSDQKAVITKQEQKNLKNLQVLMAINSSIDLCDPAVATAYRLSREELLLKLVVNLIGTGGHFQKKGYKYLSESLATAPRSLYLEVIQLFQGDVKVETGSKHYRLNVVGKLWRWLRAGGMQENIEKIISFMKTHLPEILLSLREPNKAARVEGVRIIEEFTETMQEVGLLQNFVEIVCAGLVGERSEMKLATLNGLAIILGKGYCTEEMFKEVLEIVLLMLCEKKSELYKGVVQFCKRGLLALPVEKQKKYLPAVIEQLFESDEEGKMEHRSILRHFLLRLVKKHGREMLEQLIPQRHSKMLSHTIKMQNREKRKKKQQNIARREQYLKQKAEKQQKSSGSEDDEQEQAHPHREAMEVEENDNELQELDNTNNLLLKYDLEKEQFHFQQQQQNKKELKKDERRTDEITFDDKGIMIIEERKRPRNTEEQQDEENPTVVKEDGFKKKPKVEIHQVKESGDAYRSARAGGDVYVKDRPEPYAFIQFSSKALNKRFKRRAEQVFESLFEKKEGGLRGLKARIVGNH